MADNVNHPAHYTAHPSGIECIEVVRHMSFNVGNAIKYLWRAGLKDEELMSRSEKHIEDLKKARFYLDDEIQRLEKLYEEKPR
jgi:hypothetical protein